MKNRRDEMRQIWCGTDGPPGQPSAAMAQSFDTKPFGGGGGGGGHQFDSSPFAAAFVGTDNSTALGLPSTAVSPHHLQQQQLQHHNRHQQHQLHQLQQHQLMAAAPSPSFSLTPLHIGRGGEDEGEDEEEDDDIVEDSRDSESPISDIEIAS
jgi:hypothetical protein